MSTNKQVTLSDGSVWEYGTHPHPAMWMLVGKHGNRSYPSSMPFLHAGKAFRRDALTASDLRAIADVLEPRADFAPLRPSPRFIITHGSGKDGRVYYPSYETDDGRTFGSVSREFFDASPALQVHPDYAMSQRAAYHYRDLWMGSDPDYVVEPLAALGAPETQEPGAYPTWEQLRETFVIGANWQAAGGQSADPYHLTAEERSRSYLHALTTRVGTPYLVSAVPQEKPEVSEAMIDAGLLGWETMYPLNSPDARRRVVRRILTAALSAEKERP